MADASVAVLARMRSPRQLVVDNPAAYGAAVVRSVVRRVAQGRDRLVGELPGGSTGWTSSRERSPQRQIGSCEAEPWWRPVVSAVPVAKLA